jgi:hypothetical protein
MGALELENVGKERRWRFVATAILGAVTVESFLWLAHKSKPVLLIMVVGTRRVIGAVDRVDRRRTEEVEVKGGDGCWCRLGLGLGGGCRVRTTRRVSVDTEADLVKWRECRG